MIGVIITTFLVVTGLIAYGVTLNVNRMLLKRAEQPRLWDLMNNKAYGPNYAQRLAGTAVLTWVYSMGCLLWTVGYILYQLVMR